MKALLTLVFTLGMITTASASQIEACKNDAKGDVCHHYFEGVIDGALMYKPSSVGKRVEADDYESRALKYRSGSRFQQANRTYCESRIPDREELINALIEAYSAGNINTIEELTDLVHSLMDCQRLK